MIIKFIFLQIYHMFSKELHVLEYEPSAQYSFHRVAAFIWLIAIFVAPFFHWANIGLLFIFEISLYANFATEFDAMSASLAGMIAAKGNRLKESA